MKKLKLTVSDLATEDLTNIWLYIADYSPQAAGQLIDTIYHKCCLLAESPGIGQMREELLPGMRSFPIKRYIIFYRKRLTAWK
ncbi:MAG: type II toxin-antitoxin system RelE/ParE family toxin [Thermodesulfobacteriota bacterium]